MVQEIYMQGYTMPTSIGTAEFTTHVIVTEAHMEQDSISKALCSPICSMSNPTSSPWTVPSTATGGTVTYSQATASGIGGGGVAFSNFNPNLSAITEQPHKRRG